MNTYLSMEFGPWWQVAGWTMLHFLWLGTLVAAVAFLARLTLRQASAVVRYAVALVTLAVLTALPVGIAARLSVGLAVEANPQAEVALAINANPTAEMSAENTIGSEVAPINVSTPFMSDRNVDMGADDNKLTATPPISLDESLSDFALEVTVQCLPWIWIIGTPLTFVLLTTGIVGAERLRRASRAIHDGPIADAGARLTETLRIGRRVAVAVCERVASPVLVGIVRPIILLPPAALTGWSPDEIEMVLLHELAHVRRWDNLVNLLQRFVESLLFFHPAVWLISSWVRREREACCDAIVVGRTNRPQAYAEMLVALAAQMPRSVLFHPAAASAMAARPLRGRIRRILGVDDDPMLVSGKSLAVVMSGLLLTATLAVLNLPTSGQAEESTTEVAEEKCFNLNLDGFSEPEYLQLLFTASEQNPLQTRFYQAPPSLTRSLSLAFEGLVQDPFGPKVAFESRWDPVRGAFEITAPLKAHETFFNVYIPQAIAAEGSLRPTDHESGGIGDRVDEDSGGESGGRDGSGTTLSLSVTNSDLSPLQVPFVVGAKRFLDGDRITITAVEGTSTTFEAGNTFQIEGTYTLASRPRALLLASVTARDAADGKGSNEKDQTMIVERGSGKFRLILPMKYRGWPHVSFYPADGGDGFGGVYFGTGDSVLQNWRDVYGPDDALRSEDSPTAHRVNFPTLVDQKLADLAWKRLGVELEPIGEEDLQRVQALGYDGGLRITDVRGRSTVAQLNNIFRTDLLVGDVLVGLHVWPTTSLAALAETLNRDDLAELDPLKYYVVRAVEEYEPVEGFETGEMDARGMAAKPVTKDKVITGRTSVVLPSPTDKSGRVLTTEKTADEMKQMLRSGRGTAESIPQPLQDYALPPLRRAIPGEPAPPINPADYGRVWPASVSDTGSSGPQTKQPTDLRYDGRTFDEWRDAWQTELSTDSRLKAVKALAAFGASGRGQEAAEAIVDVAGQYDWSDWRYDEHHPNKALMQLQGTCIDAFTGGYGLVGSRIPKLESLEVLLANVDSPNPQTREFLLRVIDGYRYDPRVAAALVTLSRDKERGIRSGAMVAMSEGWLQQPSSVAGPIVDRLREELRSQEQNRAQSALAIMINSVSWGNDKPAFPDVPELEPLLFASDVSTRQLARKALSMLQPQAVSAAVNRLLAIISDESRRENWREAVRALAAIGAGAKPAKERLSEMVNEKGDFARPAAVALYYIAMGENPEQTPTIQSILGDKAPQGPLTSQLIETYLQPEMDRILPEDPRSSGGGMF